jgi:predicted alpha/beta superfamily hydrolase
MLFLNFTVENIYYASGCKNGTIFVSFPPEVLTEKKTFDVIYPHMTNIAFNAFSQSMLSYHQN